MAFFGRSSSILRSALTRLHGQEQSSPFLRQQIHGQQGDSILKSLSPFVAARFMCSVPSTKLFVGGLAWGMDENALREAFVEYGDVVEAKVVLDRESGRSKGFGFVSFTCTDHAQAAKDGLDGKVLSGRQLRVNFAIEKQRGFGSFGGYGGGGFGGGDSNSSYGNSSFGSAPSFNNDSFSTGDPTNQGGNNFNSNTTSYKDSLNSGSNDNTSGNDGASGIDNSFFGDDAFDSPGDDAFGKDENLAQGFK